MACPSAYALTAICRVTWPARLGLGRLMASAWLEDRTKTLARLTRVSARARRAAGTASSARTRRAALAPVLGRILPGPALNARLAPPAPARPAAGDRMPRGRTSRRAPPPAGVPAMRWVRTARGALPPVRRDPMARGALPAVRRDPMARGALPAVRRDPMARGALPAVRRDPMARGARPFPPVGASAVPVGRRIPAVLAAVALTAGARSGA
jgi:hypothetical protein